MDDAELFDLIAEDEEGEEDMGDVWPSAVPNRLGEPAVTETGATLKSDVSVCQHGPYFYRMAAADEIPLVYFPLYLAAITPFPLVTL